MAGDGPTQSSNRAAEIKEKLKAVSYQEIDSDSGPSSPRIKAQNWIINLDQMKLPASSETMVHRYILAVLYYSLDGEDWLPSINDWLEGHMCQWSGVTCFMNREIISLTMSKFGMVNKSIFYVGFLSIGLNYLFHCTLSLTVTQATLGYVDKSLMNWGNSVVC